MIGTSIKCVQENQAVTAEYINNPINVECYVLPWCKD